MKFHYVASYVGASLEIMDRDAKLMRGERPFLFTDFVSAKGVADLANWIKERIREKQMHLAL